MPARRCNAKARENDYRVIHASLRRRRPGGDRHGHLTVRVSRAPDRLRRGCGRRRHEAAGRDHRRARLHVPGVAPVPDVAPVGAAHPDRSAAEPLDRAALPGRDRPDRAAGRPAARAATRTPLQAPGRRPRRRLPPRRGPRARLRPVRRDDPRGGRRRLGDDVRRSARRPCSGVHDRRRGAALPDRARRAAGLGTAPVVQEQRRPRAGRSRRGHRRVRAAARVRRRLVPPAPRSRLHAVAAGRRALVLGPGRSSINAALPPTRARG